MNDIKITRLREEIDLIDDDLLNLIKKRLQLSREIGEIKKENQMSIVDSLREKSLFDALKKKCRERNLDDKRIFNIWQQILEASYKSQE